MVLLKWYHNYFQEGKYQQAEQVAELAHELAPEDPETMAAVEVVRRQRTHTTPVNAERKNVEQKLDKVLNKLEQLEKHVRELEAQKAQLEKQVRVLRAQNVLRPQNQQSSRTPRREPAGSPDRID
ncbi:MAG TPA: hypothetical protein VH575_10010 [Gemmataceae bacterium]